MIAWRLAGAPTRRSSLLVNATTEGVVRLPSALGITVGSPPSRTATTELVVPRSIPTVRPICFLPPKHLWAPARPGVAAGSGYRHCRHIARPYYSQLSVLLSIALILCFGPSLLRVFTRSFPINAGREPLGPGE